MYREESVWNFTKQLKRLDRYLIGHDGFIAGGFAKSIFTEQRIKDLDIFFNNQNDFNKAVEIMLQMPRCDKEALKEVGTVLAYEELYENDNVKALVNTKTGIICELNRKIFGKPEEILDQFDFTICKFAYYIRDEVVVDSNNEPWLGGDKNGNFVGEEIRKENGYALYHLKFFEHLNLKRLVIDDKMPYPASTFHRMFKYGKQGFFPCRETKIRMMKACRKLTDEQIDSMQLYLTDGVD